MFQRLSVFAQAAARALLAICLLTALPGCAWVRSHLPASMGGTPAEAPASPGAALGPGQSGSTAARPAEGAVTAPVGTPVSTSTGAAGSPAASPSSGAPPAQ